MLIMRNLISLSVSIVVSVDPLPLMSELKSAYFYPVIFPFVPDFPMLLSAL